MLEVVALEGRYFILLLVVVEQLHVHGCPTLIYIEWKIVVKGALFVIAFCFLAILF